MKKAGIPLLSAGFLMIIVGIVLLAVSAVGILLIILGICALIFGSVMLMGVKGQRKANYFDSGRQASTNTTSVKDTIQEEVKSVWDMMEEKRE